MQADDIAINSKTYSLQELMQSVQSILQKAYAGRSFWVRCEIARISLHAQSGHCYLELIDKNESSIVAQQKGIIWNDHYDTICNKFKSVTNLSISAGMKVLFSCSVTFHPVHGMSVIITDIEPSFTLGEMARMKNETIAKLKSSGLFHLNRQKRFPAVPHRIAVISVVTSRGYQDFISTINSHPSGFRITHSLFEAILQGENAVGSLTRAFENIFLLKDNFDAIAIIRGGAGDSGLSCYDEFVLASVIAKSPLPVITGIGHATNETVAEMVSAVNCITPTAAATFLIARFEEQAVLLQHLFMRLEKLSTNYFAVQKMHLAIEVKNFSSATQNELATKKAGMQNLTASFPSEINGRFNTMKYIMDGLVRKFSFLIRQQSALHDQKLNEKKATLRQSVKNFFPDKKKNAEEVLKNLLLARKFINEKSDALMHLRDMVNLLDPVNTLKRGFTITRTNGKIITSVDSVKEGENTETEFHDGVLISIVESKKKHGKEKNI